MNSLKKNNDGHTSLKPTPQHYGMSLLKYQLSADAEVIKKMHQSVSIDKTNKEA